MNTTHNCWECNRPAMSGVCMGPHPDFSLHTKQSWRNITDDRRIMVATADRVRHSVESGETPEGYAVRAPFQRPGPKVWYCPECGRKLTPDPMGAWCEACYLVPAESVAR